MTTREQMEDAGLVVIVRSEMAADLVAVGRALADGGVRAMEITLNTPGALDGIAAVGRAMAGRLHVGAGTILTPGEADRALDAGAEFIVTPTLQPETITLCRRRGAPIACGSMTPTECLAAHNAGADFVKLFPAETLGPAYVRALRAPLPFLRLMPTGGVSLDNIADYVAAGCAGVAVGGSLVSRQILHDADWAGLTARARSYVAALAQARDSCRKGSHA